VLGTRTERGSLPATGGQPWLVFGLGLLGIGLLLRSGRATLVVLTSSR
jgi:hypothetical protein